MLVIVPNALRDAINAKLDAALADAPDDAKAEREFLYQQLLEHFNEHGTIPDFTVVLREQNSVIGRLR